MGAEISIVGGSDEEGDLSLMKEECRRIMDLGVGRPLVGCFTVTESSQGQRTVK